MMQKEMQASPQTPTLQSPSLTPSSSKSPSILEEHHSGDNFKFQKTGNKSAEPSDKVLKLKEKR